MAPLAIGSDTGGSIRQPAAFCGVVGLKPTYGRVSRYGLVAFASSLDQVGPFGRTIERRGPRHRGPERARPSATPRAPPPSLPGLRRTPSRGHAAGLRIGVPWGSLAEGVEPETLARFREALAALEAEGASVVDVELPHLRHAVATYYLIATAEASSNLARFDGVRYGHRATDAPDLREMYGRSRDEGFGAEVKRRIILGTFALSSGYYDAYYLRAQKVRTLVRRDFEQAFERCDVVATPTTPTPAFGLGEKTDDPLQMYLADIFTVPANLAGIPGLSLPCGLAGGLPVGLQLLGRPFDEETLVRCGAAYQRATRHHELAPPELGLSPGSVTRRAGPGWPGSASGPGPWARERPLSWRRTRTARRTKKETPPHTTPSGEVAEDEGPQERPEARQQRLVERPPGQAPVDLAEGRRRDAQQRRSPRGCRR